MVFESVSLDAFSSYIVVFVTGTSVVPSSLVRRVPQLPQNSASGDKAFPQVGQMLRGALIGFELP